MNNYITIGVHYGCSSKLGSSVQSSIAGEWGSSKSPYYCNCNWIDGRNLHRYCYNFDDRYRHEILQGMILADLIATIHEFHHHNIAAHSCNPNPE